MSAKQLTLSAELVDEVKRLVWNTTSPAIREMVAIQLWTIRESQRRVEEEGVVVRDMRGSVVAHPCIKIVADATKVFETLMKKHGKGK